MTWNVRRLNKPPKQKDKEEYFRRKKVSLAGLLETKIKVHKFQRSYTRVAKGWAYLNNNNYVDNGRIWLIWKNAEVCVLQ